MIKVRATRKGYYGEKRRNENDVFFITSEDHFSERWMEKTDKTVEASLRQRPARVQNPVDPRDLNHAIAVTAENPEIKAMYESQPHQPAIEAEAQQEQAETEESKVSKFGKKHRGKRDEEESEETKKVI